MSDNNNSNRQRAFADVVSLDGWTQDPCDQQVSFNLHTDVVFGQARLGGEIESLVRFKMAVTRAELVVIVSETEPAIIDKRSVERFGPTHKAEREVTVTNTEQIGGEVDASIGIANNVPKITAALKANAGAKAEKISKSVSKETVLPIKIIHSLDGDKNNRWQFEADDGGNLNDRPWDVINQSILRVKDTRKDVSKGIKPNLRLIVRCLREDIQITDIEIKKEEKSGWFKGKPNNMKAAEAYIRNVLDSERLQAGDVEDKFASIELATVEVTIGE